MRVGEAIALERDDVDLDAGVITIREQSPSSSEPGWCRCTRRPPTRCAATPARETAYAHSHARDAFFLSAAGTVLDRSACAQDVQHDHHRARAADRDGPSPRRMISGTALPCRP